MLLKVIQSPRKGKRYLAIFDNGKKTHFGQEGGNTYLDHQDKNKREAYRARAKGMLKKTDKFSPSHLSYYLLWGDDTNLQSAINSYNKKFF